MNLFLDEAQKRAAMDHSTWICNYIKWGERKFPDLYLKPISLDENKSDEEPPDEEWFAKNADIFKTLN